MSLKPSKMRFSPSPSWEVLSLVAENLDPKTLAIGSCVSKSWFQCLSSNHLWESICIAQYPSIFTQKDFDPAVSYQRLYRLGHTAAKRHLQNPPKPYLSLENLIFSINIRTKQNFHIASMAVPGEDLVICRLNNDTFKFDIKSEGHEFCGLILEEGVKINWNILSKGMGGVFCTMECEGKLDSVGSGLDHPERGWFSEELPSPGFYSKEIMSGLVADLKLGICSGGGMMSVSVGLMNKGSWRYVSVDDALRYLQYFLIVT